MAMRGTARLVLLQQAVAGEVGGGKHIDGNAAAAIGHGGVEIAFDAVAARPAPTAVVVLPNGVMQAHQVAEFMRQRVAGTAPHHRGIPAGKPLHLLGTEMPSFPVCTHGRPAAGTRIGRALAKEDVDIGTMPLRRPPHGVHVRPARRVLLVLDLHRHRAHQAKAHVDAADVDNLIRKAEKVRYPRGGIAELFLVATAVESHHIDGGTPRRRICIIWIGAPQPFVGIGHAIPIRVPQIIEIPNPEPPGGPHGRLHPHPILLLPVVPLLLLKHEFQRALGSDLG